jgi:excisionase family DNA binding protein
LAKKGGEAMLPDERYVTVEDAAKQLQVQPITLRRWLAIGTMPQYAFEGIGYVLQSDVDAFNEACLCRNQKVYKPKPAKAVAS